VILHSSAISRCTPCTPSCSDVPGTAAAYERAIALSTNAVERAELDRRLRVLRQIG
jgi:hypothetical protein